jgi:hypothetical protein
MTLVLDRLGQLTESLHRGDAGSAALANDGAVHVLIAVTGVLPNDIALLFPELNVSSETFIQGELPDQAALHGILDRIRRLGLSIADVKVAP